MAEVDERYLIDSAEKNLQRQIEWVSRVETRSSLIFGISVGMLGYLASILPHFSIWPCWFIFLLIATLGLKIAVIGFLFRAQFPRTEAPKPSLIFFGEIVKFDLDEFMRRAKSCDWEQYLDDLLAQTHVNGQIVSSKFIFVKRAMISLLISSIFWFPAVLFARMLTPLS
tara:strand:- start:485 stop:991 length:507 start_codon:yes stop_codon:yes gene_type:complete